MARTSTDYIFIHCAFTRDDQDFGATEIDKWHRQKGWLMIGYHFVIRRDGTIETGRSIDAQGAHAIGFNSKSIGICLMGGMDEDGKPADNYTPEQMLTLARLVHSLKHKYDKAQVVGHNEYSKKPCPNFDVRVWWAKNQTGSALCPTCNLPVPR